MGKKRKHKMAASEIGIAADIEASVRDRVDDLFHKEFRYQKDHGDDQWSLPEPSEMFSSRSWCNAELQQMKAELNAIKSLLSDKEITAWHKHTQQTNPAGDVITQLRRDIQPELCTQAWCKFYELLSRFPIVSPDSTSNELRTAHLCEAPGAFITSLNHYLVQKCPDVSWAWLATTLNPYYEGNDLLSMISDDRFIFDTLDNWYFGEDNTGNLMSKQNLHGLIEKTKTGVNLVTADGSIDCQDNPSEQEIIVSQLHFCEVIVSLSLLTLGGTLVLKMFTLFEDTSVCLVYLLNCIFQEVKVVKPATSKPGNSEVYLVCLQYRGIHKIHLDNFLNHYGEKNDYVMFCAEDIPASFIGQHIQCARTFKNYQEETIQSNLQLFTNMSADQMFWLEQARQYCAERFLEMCDIWPIRGQERIVCIQTDKKSKKSRTEGARIVNKQRRHGTYNGRCEIKGLPWQQRLSMMKLNEVTVTDSLQCLEMQNCNSLNQMDIAEWRPVEGRQLATIHSSRFCEVSVIGHYNDLISNCQAKLKKSLNTLKIQEEILNRIMELTGVLSDDNMQVVSLRSDRGHDLSSKKAGKTQVKSLVAEDLGTGNTTGMKIFRIGSLPECKCSSRMAEQDSGLKSEVINACKAAKDSQACEQVLNRTVQKEFLIRDLITAIEKMHDGDAVMCEVPDMLTRFNVAVFFVHHLLFEKVALHKSSSSDWTSLNAHIIGVNYRGCPPVLKDYLIQVRSKFEQIASTNSELDILQIIPMRTLYEQHFYSYLYTFNENTLKGVVNCLITWERMLLHTESSSSSSSSSSLQESPVTVSSSIQISAKSSSASLSSAAFSQHH